jgi:adenosylhomocysteinase
VLEAYADGFDVLPALEATEIGELFSRPLGAKTCSASRTSNGMRDSAILAND